MTLPQQQNLTSLLPHGKSRALLVWGPTLKFGLCVSRTGLNHNQQSPAPASAPLNPGGPNTHGAKGSEPGRQGPGGEREAATFLGVENEAIHMAVP